jgi:penicillin amidase
MQSLQADVRSNLAARVVPDLIVAAQGQTLSPDGMLVLSALQAWDFECPTGLSDIDPMSAKDADAGRAASSIGCAAFHVLWSRLIGLTFNDELAGLGITPRVSAMVFAISAPSALIGSYWDDVSTAGSVETMGDVVAAALDEAGAFLSTNVGPAADDWRWGRIHTVTLSADIFPPDSDTYANDGGLYTVDVANPNGMFNGNFTHGSGASMRLSCEADAADGVRCTIELPGGQRHFADSPHFTDLFLKWLVNDPSPIHFAATDVAAASVETLTIRAE